MISGHRRMHAAVIAGLATIPAIVRELFEEAFYEKKNLDPKMHDETTSQTVDVPDDVDAELLAKVLANPEMKALLASLAKTMK